MILSSAVASVVVVPTNRGCSDHKVLESGDKAVAARIAARFPTRFLRDYVYWKMRTDPIYRVVSESVAGAQDLPLLDLGCGTGVLAFYLREHGFTGAVHGVDLDAPKIKVAKEIAASLSSNAVFDRMDFRDVRDGSPGHVTMLDVLLFVPEATQKELLARAAFFVEPERGVLIVRSGIGDGSWRHRLTSVMDHMACFCRWMKLLPVKYPSREIFLEVLGPLGFDVEFRPLWGRMPFNNHVIIARKRRS